jgi:hypothetical protein
VLYFSNSNFYSYFAPGDYKPKYSASPKKPVLSSLKLNDPCKNFFSLTSYAPGPGFASFFSFFYISPGIVTLGLLAM